jgi:sec-independent protein translocase protein TatB
MNFGLSGEIVFIMLLALILFGPRRMPEIARQIGRFMADFKNASNALETQIREEMRKLEFETSEPLNYEMVSEEKKETSAAGEEVVPRA